MGPSAFIAGEVGNRAQRACAPAPAPSTSRSTRRTMWAFGWCASASRGGLLLLQLRTRQIVLKVLPLLRRHGFCKRFPCRRAFSLFQAGEADVIPSLALPLQ